MRIEVLEGPTGLLLIHVLGGDRLACEAAYNRFLLNHNLKYWNLIVRASFPDQSLFAQSIAPDGRASDEIGILDARNISEKLTELLRQELSQWMRRAATAQAPV
jgi:hypothetical protein